MGNIELEHRIFFANSVKISHFSYFEPCLEKKNANIPFLIYFLSKMLAIELAIYSILFFFNRYEKKKIATSSSQPF